MRYKQLPKNSDYRLNVPALSGGLRADTDATLIADDQLVDVNNLRWKEGALRTRKALRAVGRAPIGYFDGNADYALDTATENITPHPFEIDGELCVVVIEQAGFAVDNGAMVSSCRRLHVITLNGVVKATYTMQGQAPNVNIIQPMVAIPCDELVHGYPFLVYHGKRVYKPDDASASLILVSDDMLYAPLVSAGGRSYLYSTMNIVTDTPLVGDGGVRCQAPNMLTRRFRARYTGGHEAGLYELYYLPLAVSSTAAVTVEGNTAQGHFCITVSPETDTPFYLHDGEGVVNYTAHFSAEEGSVRITPPLPASTVSDNIEITATAATATEETVAGATIATWFGGTSNRFGGTRVFLAGFADSPAKVMWSDVNNPLYFPENNYMFVGDMSQKVTALEKQEDMLVIFKERELYYTTYVQGSIDKDAVIEGTNVDVTVSQAYFPLTQLSPYIGCDCPYTIAACRNRLVWLNADGRVYTLASVYAYSERNVREIGVPIYLRLLSETTAEERRIASAADFDGCYCLLIGSTMYLFDYADSGFVNITNYASGGKAAKNIAWYRYTFDGFAHGAWQRILSDGAHKALVLSTCHSYMTGGEMRCQNAFVRVAYVFADADTDAYMALTSTAVGVVNASVTDSPITASFTTKAYDFGDISAFKRIKALYLAAKGYADVSFAADGEVQSPRRFIAHTMSAHLVMPMVKRCQTLAVCVHSTTPLAVRGMCLHYQPFGTVR